jgi:two-component system, response regulator PdtaR
MPAVYFGTFFGGCETRMEGMCKVLIIEDEPLIGAAIAQLVTNGGHLVVGVAPSGEQAVIIAERERPHLATVDVSLASPLDGVTTANVLMDCFDTRILFVTAHPIIPWRSYTAVKPLILGKPFSDSELQRAVDIACEPFQ